MLTSAPLQLEGPTRRVVVPWVGRDPAVDALIYRLGGAPASFFPGNLTALRKPKVLVRGLFDEPAAVADPKGEWLVHREVPVS